MARKLDDIFNECYERMRMGESLESCLMRYPEHAAELEPLLKTTFDIGRRASYIQPRPEFKHWSRVRLEGAQHYAGQQRQPAKPSLFSWRQSWAVAVTAVLVLLLTGGSTVAASSDALPDEPLYPVKLATEQVRLAFAISDTSKAELHTQLAETRAAEIEAMADQGKTEYAAIAAEKLANQLEQANLAMAKVESVRGEAAPSTATPETTVTAPVPPVPPSPPGGPPTPPVVQPSPTEEQPTPTEGQPTPPTATTQDKGVTTKTEHLKKSLEKSTSKSLTALENALEKAPQQAKPDLQRAIDIISEKSHGKPSQEPGTGAGETGNEDKDNGKTGDKSNGKEENKPTSVKPEPSQPSSTSDNNTGNGKKPNPVSPSQTQPSSTSDNNTGNGKKPNPVSPSQTQPSSTSDNNTGNGKKPNPVSPGQSQSSSQKPGNNS